MLCPHAGDGPCLHVCSSGCVCPQSVTSLHLSCLWELCFLVFFSPFQAGMCHLFLLLS